MGKSAGRQVGKWANRQVGKSAGGQIGKSACQDLMLNAKHATLNETGDEDAMQKSAKVVKPLA